MAFQIEGSNLTVESPHAWAMWVFYGCFAFGFPPALIAMWKYGADEIPTWVMLLFTIVSLGILPFLLVEMAKQRLVTARIYGATGIMEISQRGLITSSREIRWLADIDRIEMLTLDNDGEYFSLHVIFRDGGSFAFRHGNHRPSMEAERDRFLDFIRKRRSGVRAAERFVAE